MDDSDDKPLDLDRLDAVARASWDYPWEVARSNGWITAIQAGDHRVTVACATNIDEEFSRIDMREEEMVYFETFAPPTVRRMLGCIHRLTAELDDAQGMRESWAANSAQWEDYAKVLGAENAALKAALREALDKWDGETEVVARLGKLL